MTDFKLGNLSNSYTNRYEHVSGTYSTDVYLFNVVADSNINLLLEKNSYLYPQIIDIELFSDTNQNGVLDGDDQLVATSLDPSKRKKLIGYNATAGTYFAQVAGKDMSRHDYVFYDLRLVVEDTPSGTAPNTYEHFTPSRTFALNSNLAAKHTIYLDFDGHVTTNTDWNGRAGIPQRFATSAYDTDGNQSFSAFELQDIWHIWQRVSEDFSPFDVNVTTVLPTADQLINSGQGDTQWGVRVVVGGDGAWWGKPATVGVGLFDSFTDAADTPVFAFSEKLGGKVSVAEAITHEVGHSLGLEHDGAGPHEYYEGSADRSWAPIMGIADGNALTQWSKGEYSGATNQEDDLDIITGQNGFGYRDDDHGDRMNTATALSGNTVETYGVIETNTDVDWFSFSVKSGDIKLKINSFERGANLNILAEIYDAKGQLISSGDIADSLSVGFSGTTDPGQYFLSVTGTGQGDPVMGGYSDYGSLGQYAISGTLA